MYRHTPSAYVVLFWGGCPGCASLYCQCLFSEISHAQLVNHTCSWYVFTRFPLNKIQISDPIETKQSASESSPFLIHSNAMAVVINPLKSSDRCFCTTIGYYIFPTLPAGNQRSLVTMDSTFGYPDTPRTRILSVPILFHSVIYPPSIFYVHF